MSPGLDQGTKPKQQQVWYCSVQEGLGQSVAVMVEAVEAGVLSGAFFSLSLLSAALPSCWNNTGVSPPFAFSLIIMGSSITDSENGDMHLFSRQGGVIGTGGRAVLPNKKSHLVLTGIVAGGVSRWPSGNRKARAGDRQEAPERL